MISGHNIRILLEKVGWKKALVIDELVYPNLVRYSNMEVSATRKNTIVTSLGRIHIEFNVYDLNRIVGSLNDGLDSYTSRKYWILMNFIIRMGFVIYVGIETSPTISVHFLLGLSFCLFRLESSIVSSSI